VILYRFKSKISLRTNLNKGLQYLYREIGGGGMEMGELFLILYWTGPVGTGIFLLCLGGMIYLLSKADAIKKSARRR
jgi:hypothetical protein